MEIDTIKVTPVHLKSSPFNNNYLYLHAHLQKYGWYGCNCCGPLHMNQFAGTRGQSRRMEAYSNNFNMIKQFHLYITLFIFSYNACISQTYKLNGYVEDAGSKERLIYTQDKEGLIISRPLLKPCKHAYTIKIEVK